MDDAMFVAPANAAHAEHAVFLAHCLEVLERIFVVSRLHANPRGNANTFRPSRVHACKPPRHWMHVIGLWQCLNDGPMMQITMSHTVENTRSVTHSSASSCCFFAGPTA